MTVFCGQPVPDGVLPGLFLALFGDRSSAELRITPVGLDLAERRHLASWRRIGFVSSICIRAATPTCFPLKLAVKSVSPVRFAAAAISCVLAQRIAATGNGSISCFSHHARSLPPR